MNLRPHLLSLLFFPLNSSKNADESLTYRYMISDIVSLGASQRKLGFHNQLQITRRDSWKQYMNNSCGIIQKKTFPCSQKLCEKEERKKTLSLLGSPLMLPLLCCVSCVSQWIHTSRLEEHFASWTQSRCQDFGVFRFSLGQIISHAKHVREHNEAVTFSHLVSFFPSSVSTYSLIFLFFPVLPAALSLFLAHLKCHF